MKVRLERTDEYLLQRENLSRSARLALRFVERAIKGSPDETAFLSTDITNADRGWALRTLRARGRLA